MMRCSKMAMRRNMEMRMAVAAKPKEMALAFVDDDPSSFTPSSLAFSPDDGVASPIHGLPAKPLMAWAAWLADPNLLG